MESSSDRAKRLVKEARRLKSEREDKRRAFADEQLERQWKEGCDDLRTIDSQFFKIHCNTEVLKQIDDKQVRRGNAQVDKQRWAAEWEAERLKKVQQEDSKQLHRHHALLENRRDLKNQMDEQEAKKQEDFTQLQKEKAIFQKILEMDAQAAARKAVLEHERKREKAKENVAYNEQLQADREAAYRAQREADKKDLAEKMEEYKSDTLREENDKANQRRDIIEFKAYLERRRVEERKMERELERLVQEDLDRANMKRDMQWEKERLAREKLMKDVYQTRSEQLQSRASERQREEEELYVSTRIQEAAKGKVAYLGVRVAHLALLAVLIRSLSSLRWRSVPPRSRCHAHRPTSCVSCTRRSSPALVAAGISTPRWRSIARGSDWRWRRRGQNWQPRRRRSVSTRRNSSSSRSTPSSSRRRTTDSTRRLASRHRARHPVIWCSTSRGPRRCTVPFLHPPSR